MVGDLNDEAIPEVEISVVVPTYRRPDLLERCLTALVRQTLPADRFEIVICDDGPSEAAEAVVRRVQEMCGGRPSLIYVPVPDTQGPAAARNAGWQRASGDVIAFTDDDTIPEPDWLWAGLTAMSAGVCAASGKIVMPLPERPSDIQRDASHLQFSEFATANCFVRRSALMRLGGFDERFEIAWREDSDLHFSLLEQGSSIIQAPAAVVIHPFRPVPFAAGIGMQRKVLYDTLLYRKHPRLYRERVRRGPPWFYLALVSLLLLAVALYAAGLFQASWLAAGAWAALTLCFFIRRLRGSALTVRNIGELAITSAIIPVASIYWRLVGLWKFGPAFP